MFGGGQAEHYQALLKERENEPRSPDEQKAIPADEKGVGRLVGDDVERLAGEDRPPGQGFAAALPARGEVAEEQGVPVGVVVGVGVVRVPSARCLPKKTFV